MEGFWCFITEWALEMWTSNYSFQKFHLLEPFFQYHGVQKLAFFELHDALLWHFPSPSWELFFFISSCFSRSAVHCGTPLCRTLSSLLLAACCVQVEMESSPGVALSLNGAVKAVERGGQEFDWLRQCWGKSQPRDCFSSRFTDQSRRRMRRRRDSENTQVAVSGSLMKE